MTSGERPMMAQPRAASGAASAMALAVVIVLGFASGLPLSLTGYTLQAWLAAEGVDVATIGVFSLIGLPYTFKFLWAPLMDRFDLPVLGRRRAWLVLAQAAIALALYVMADLMPSAQTRAFAVLALVVAFLSASQDIVADAYRTELLAPPHHGIGSSVFVVGYWLAMMVSGGLTLIWTDPTAAGGRSWSEVYRWMAGLMAAMALLSAVLLPALPSGSRPATSARRDLLGCAAVLAAAGLGWCFTDKVLQPGAVAALLPLMADSGLTPGLQLRWAQFVGLLLGMTLSVALAVAAARVARFETLVQGLSNYFMVPGALGFLVLIVLYRLGDSLAGSLTTPFLLQAMRFGPAEVGVVNRVIGLWLAIAGGVIGGWLMLKLGLWRSLLAFGVLKTASIVAFAALAWAGKGLLPGVVIPAFDWGIVRVTHAIAADGGLFAVVALDSVSGGMMMAPFGALLMGLCNQRFTATQFALLSALAAVGRVWAGPLAGVLAESLGWAQFFLVAACATGPGLWLLVRLRPKLQRLG